ncbi:Crp/Fnr family transcriptional regulator [Streptomyces apricus]|uniref:Crp/Fnr family transcriptional regulator n=1 Tax=Streptomyces apricus TaxID=1828112 RepID=A0A5B0AZQ8_9ACTN|nr:Crp/Fnr family transcriptional regulator [Streptomyces apricus]KAA0934672.1 Crp/Fnr family transcriptional regulator [Streptomyces apricus]
MPPTLEAARPIDLQDNTGMPEGSFPSGMSAGTWQRLLQAGLRSRRFNQGDNLPMGRTDRSVYIIWEGAVKQERFPLGTGDNLPTVTRFRGRGQVVGEAKLITPDDSSVRTQCLTRTVVIPCEEGSFNALLRQRLEIQRALLRSLEARNRSDELLYTLIRPPLERVGRLLVHLADTAGAPDPETSHRTVISGITQKDIAAALQIGVSTTENALRTLRYHGGIVEARYRQIVVNDVDKLRHSVPGH